MGINASAKLLRSEAGEGHRRGSGVPVRKEIYLHPGQSYVTGQAELISMILGSCVGVCLFDPHHQIAGATHFMLASWDGTGKASPRYGDVAINDLLEQLELRGATLKDLQASLFGGSSMFAALQREDGDDIGSRNVRMALGILEKRGIRIIAKHTGGHSGRKVHMQTDTGHIAVSLIGNP
jgi:chemotaxis protein CheD